MLFMLLSISIEIKSLREYKNKDHTFERSHEKTNNVASEQV